MPEPTHAVPDVPIHTAHTSHDADGPLWTPHVRRRAILCSIGVLLVVLLVVLPPYISVSRYQRRVMAAISGALGRPVHFDRISLQLLPLPALTIDNFVVDDLPQFGSEPVMRANTVRARLRFGSLWRRRIEVSRISLDAPSINLVRRPDGSGWNLQSILTQASQIDSAPTAQPRAGDAPRFPYIEATDARLNFKNGIDKLPFSLRNAEFALWLPEPGQWRLRLDAQPVRTDTDVSDVGLLRVEASLGRAANISAAPIELNASWKPTPLGEATKLTAGYDMGWRGEVSAEMTVQGTVGLAKAVADLHLNSLRRADFVPAHTAEVNAHCEAVAAGPLRSLHDLRCAVPTNQDTSMFSAIEGLHRFTAPSTKTDEMPDGSLKPGVLLVRGEVPQLFDWRSITLQASLKGADAGYPLAWLRLLSPHVPAQSALGGTVDLSAWKDGSDNGGSRWGGTMVCNCTLPAAAAEKTPERWNVVLTYGVRGSSADASNGAVAVNVYPRSSDVATDIPTVESASEGDVSGQLSRGGYTLIYKSPVLVKEAARVLPSLAAGLPADAAGPLQAEHIWGSPQTWTAVAAPVRKPASRRR